MREASEGINSAVARRMWLATAEGDSRALERVLAEDVVWRAHGSNPLSGEFRSRDVVIGRMAELADRVDDLRLSLCDVFSSSQGAVISYEFWARRGRQVLESSMMLRLRIEAGRITECDLVPEDQGELDTFLNWIH